MLTPRSGDADPPFRDQFFKERRDVANLFIFS